MAQTKFRTEEAVKNSMLGSLGIEMIREDAEELIARMPVNERTRQPFGVLCGGATLAFAEILAGIGSYFYCADDEIPVGSSVSGNHISSVKAGPDVYVYGYATCLHKGRSTHIWNVDVKTEQGKLISSVRVTNFVVKDKTSSWH